jgi:hypothetical protein
MSGEALMQASSCLGPKAQPHHELCELHASWRALVERVLQQHPGSAFADVMHALCTNDDPLFDAVVNATRALNEAVAVASRPTWTSWRQGTWACACDGMLMGPFDDAASLEAAMRDAWVWQGSLKWCIQMGDERV